MGSATRLFDSLFRFDEQYLKAPEECRSILIEFYEMLFKRVEIDEISS